jgi:hypothetical protein
VAQLRGLRGAAGAVFPHQQGKHAHALCAATDCHRAWQRLPVFALYPAWFQHSLPEYHHTCLETVLILTFLVPWIHSITFNILNKPIVEKILLTAISMAYLLLEAPLHYFLAAVVMHYGSLMFMPMLFILFSLMLNVMMLIAFYAWAMSWEFGSGHQSS